MTKILGLDIGSVVAKAVLLDDQSKILGRWESKSRSCPLDAILNLLEGVLEKAGYGDFRIGITGYGREGLAFADSIYDCNDIAALAYGAFWLECRARSVIEVGGQSTQWVRLEGNSRNTTKGHFLDFVINERCAAGSGAFIEQQAARLKVNIEAFSKLAAQAETGAPIAGRCSVFAKSDMIHLQQKGTPIEEIAYGLCLSVARNFVGTILKGKQMVPPVLFAGGGARNDGLARAFREVLDIKDENFIRSSLLSYECALGAGLAAQEFGGNIRISAKEDLVRMFETAEKRSKSDLRSLGVLTPFSNLEPHPSPEEKVKGFLGLDVGSVSTNLVLIDEMGEIKAGVYLPTRGRPLEVIKESLEKLFEMCKGGLEIMGIGTTGSGRYLAGKFIKADVIYNEITAQMKSAFRYFPDADTIFEIGGQDSKYIYMKDGRIKDFTMNKICSAGTGSFLEEQAGQLEIEIENEFSAVASRSKSPYDLGCRCTVFMNTELVNALSKGVSIPDITAGLAYSIAKNYLDKVVENRTIGDNIVFQGGVASNPAVVKAFSLILGKPIRVHPFNRVSGAIGAAMIARDTVAKNGKKSPEAPSLRERLSKDYTITSFECRHCSNCCQVNRIVIEDETIHFGDTCERYTTQSGLKTRDGKEKTPDLFRERKERLYSYIQNPKKARRTIGIPMVSFMLETFPFWAVFFNRIGFKVKPSHPSNARILEDGLKKLPAETCLPIKLAFGHAQWFAGQEVDGVFLPSIIDSQPKDSIPLCPYAENVPFMIKAAVDVDLLTPRVDLNRGSQIFLRCLSSIKDRLDVSPSRCKEAYTAAIEAQQDFYSYLKSRGRDIIENNLTKGKKIWVVLGKPYNIHDKFLNLNLSRHLIKLGVLAVPYDFLDFDVKLGSWPRMPVWQYNRRMIKAALWAAETSGVYPVIISNFGCGPDAFTIKHLTQILKGKSHLILEFDEHRAEAGLITRLEAFMDEIEEGPVEGRSLQTAGLRKTSESLTKEELKERKFLLPYFADHVYAFSGSLKARSYRAECLPPPDEKSLSLGEKYSSGKECHPYAILTGDLMKLALSERKDEEVFFFPGSKYSCLLHQYGEAMSMLLEEHGIHNITVLAPSMEFFFTLLGIEGLTLLWRGLVAIDLLIKAACEKRPYEVQKGQTDIIHRENLKDIEQGLAEQDFYTSLDRCIQRLGGIKIRYEPKPLVGIAGDIYTRINPVGNHDLFLKLEGLGCEVWPAPFLVDSIGFGLRKTLHFSVQRKRFHESASVGLLHLRKELESWKVKKNLKRAVKKTKEPSFREVVAWTSPYIGLENNDILLLNIAKMVDFAQRGADGVINAICFNCMLGTISEAIAARIRRDYKNIPIPTMIFSGTSTPTEKKMIEAFIFQVYQYAKEKKSLELRWHQDSLNNPFK
ncbi:MAG: hypothetical protein JXB26_07605 [Candidatus Aminicenantes bacterium]|nr:hypothetical protein [Candidatus Aminicenantes bacterium]